MNLNIFIVHNRKPPLLHTLNFVCYEAMLFISDSVFLETNKNSDNSSLFEEFQWLVLFVVMNSKNVFSKSFLMPFFLLTT